MSMTEALQLFTLIAVVVFEVIKVAKKK